MDAKTHWDEVYANSAHETLSWYRAHLEKSLIFIERAAESRSAAILDVGGGESTLVDDLLVRGYQNVTVLDVSQNAIVAAKKRLGPAAEYVHWIVADINEFTLEPKAYDIWHDRAVFHFLTELEQRVAYVRRVIRSVRSGGYLIVSTFGPQGPTKCSGLEVSRYDAESLHREFGAHFRLLETPTEQHHTPTGTVQQFVYCYCRVE
jgi:2-polyprenyl-3-methyl-5-hydroxy-6-metoxy-1,4-benzoquinol methylase